MFAEYRPAYKQEHAEDMLSLAGIEEPETRQLTEKSRRLSVHLDNIGHGLIVSLPVAMVVANRSSPLLLTCAALFILAARLISGTAAPHRLAVRRPRTGVLILVLCGVAYPLVTLGWAIKPAVGLFSWGEAVLPAVSSAILILSWRAAPPPRWMAKGLALALMIAAALIAAELLLNFPLRHILRDRVGTFIHNRPTVTLFLLLGPVIALLGFRKRRTLCLVLLLATVPTIVISDSEAAKLGLLAAVGTLALSYAPFAWVRRFLTVALLCLIWVQPFFGGTVARSVPDSMVEATKGAHTRERIELWQAFSDVARRYPVFGTGFASSPHLGNHPIAAEINPAYREMLKVGHPHNAFLQVWVELGAVGALLLSFLTLWVMRCLATAPADIRRVGLMTLMSASAIALVSHGAWQGWWISAVTLAAALLTLRSTSRRNAQGPK
ncbi:O-antigen ligase family protein [Microvirga sp. HBU67558]|uniref:O-antigen ligase family protein n=1 Tax=Microvirga TaxID=186650 RepID=UPI001B3768D6|nr:MULTISPECIES: O-antigen ligase family protein [unclassified Microvirga]MBQ0823886.1 O-antigen ligase family protein [Microvirga sp. HBU67558]